MNKEHIYKTILSKLNDMGYKNAEIDENTNLFSDLGLDSLDAVELTMTLEQEYDIKIPDEKVNDIKTIKDAVEIVNMYMK